MGEIASVVASLLTRSRDPSPLLRHPTVYSCCLATNEARRCATRDGSALLGSARRKHRFVYCCVIVGACFDVTALAWSKYATVLTWILDRTGCYGLDWSGSGWGPAEGSCEHGNEPCGSIKYWDILEWVNGLLFTKKSLTRWSLFNNVDSSSDCVEANGLNNELQIVWREVVVALFEALS
jgi:hypothetical protein